jgi:hypothetical protein
MKKKNLKPMIISSLLAIGLGASCVGTTFALFTDRADTKINVTAGVVQMEAELNTLKAYHAEYYDGDNDENHAGNATAFETNSNYKYVPSEQIAENSFRFINGGLATLTDEQTLTLDRVTPGDKVTLKLKMTNESNVNIKYRLRVNAITDTGIFDELDIRVNNEELLGVTRVDAWTVWTAPGTAEEKVKEVPIEVALPIDAGNEYQNKSTSIRFRVEAVQGNATVDSLLDQVNAYLKASTPRFNKTMYDAIEEAHEQYPLFVGTNYLWSPDSDQFFAESDTEAGFEGRYFKAYEAMPTTQTYNIYAFGNWSATTIDNLKVGFDAGDVAGITSITYDRSTETSAKHVYIRSNSFDTTVNINAPLDTVDHYGNAAQVNVVQVAGQSYHEYGKVSFVEVAAGRVALESSAEVGQVHFVKDTEQTFKPIIVSIDENVELPSFSRDPVDIPDGGTLVVALQAGTGEITEETELDYVWLTKQGIFEQIKISESDEKITSTAKWADEDEVEADTQQAAKDIANNIGRNASTNEVEDTVTIGTTEYAVTLDEETRELIVKDGDDVVEDASTIETVVGESVSEAGLNEQQKQAAIDEHVEESKIDEIEDSGDYKARIGINAYETVAAAIEAAKTDDVVTMVGDATESVSINKNITLDLNNHALTAPSNKAALTVYSLDYVTIKNGDINGQIRIGEHQYTIAKYKMDGSPMWHYHPLAPAKNVQLINLDINSGDKVALYYTNIEDDLTRADKSNPTDNDLYGHYLYKTGYTSAEQYTYKDSKRDEVFTECYDKDYVVVTNCDISASTSLVGNMAKYDKAVEGPGKELYTEVLNIQSGTFNNDSLGRFLGTGKYLVGSSATKFDVASSPASEYKGKVNNIYYTYEGGANDAITYANFGEVVYIKESADREKVFGMDDTLTVAYETENIEYTGAKPVNQYKIKTKASEEIENAIFIYTTFNAVAEVYKTGEGNSGNNKAAPDYNDPTKFVGRYPTVAEAFAAANTNGQWSCVRLIDDYEGGDDAKYYYTDKARTAGAHSGSSVRFDLNGYTWTYTGTRYALDITTTSGSSAKDTVILDSSANKTGTIYAPNGQCIYKENSGGENSRIQSGNFIAKTYALNLNKLSADKKTGRWYIENGRFVSTTTSVICLGWTHSSGLLEIYNGTFESGGSNTTKDITSSFGTSPIQCKIYGGTFSKDPANFGTNVTIPSGKSIHDNGDGTYTVS